MTSSSFNPRMTVVIVIAFLFIVALFIRPGGTAEQATDQLTDVAHEIGTKPAAVVTAPAGAAPAAWYAAAPESGPPPAPPAQQDAAPVAAPGAMPEVAPNPPPQGADFPQNR